MVGAGFHSFNLNCKYSGITQYVGYLKYHYV